MCILYQYAHAYVFEQKRYDGLGIIEDLKAHGDIGLGTFSGMDGELVVTDHGFYKCADAIAEASGSSTTPWAAVTRFTDEAITEEVADVASMQDFVDKLLRSTQAQDFPYALQLESVFEAITFRQVLKQPKPYTDIQTVFDTSPNQTLHNVKAKLVGFYMPEHIYPLHPIGIHLHGITEDNANGGHVLDFKLSEGTLRFEIIEQIKMDLKLI